ncbi:MAG: hypothetical protein IKW96_10040 [Ruminococcus sp.]|uniref:hypothetical protein n=1 Tax=Ruminococcus sp. TaxID=41978 RepID=UPI0025D13FA8|nr:hypothetical protein [Ruminococcus sp.]MBR5683592.1 hypothetical protein [Ruminococcus sp.]
MKNVIRKIAAAAMAFTIIGTGTAVTKYVAPQLDNSIVASAKKEKTETFLNIAGNNAQVACYPGVNSRVAPSMKAKPKKTYYQGEIFQIKRNKKGEITVISDDHYDWVVTTSGYYVPARYHYNYV